MTGRRKAQRRPLTLIAAIGIVALMSSMPLHRTDAAWTDSIHATAPQLTALQLQSPEIIDVSCGGLLGLGDLRVTWHWPDPVSSYTGSASNLQWYLDGTALEAQPESSGPSANGQFVTTFSGGLLEDLLGSLGAEFVLEANTSVRYQAEAPWVSELGMRVTVNPGLLVSNCDWADNVPVGA